ncbi:hypothetical protein JMF89_02840 [Clostridiaceae bacterium UIB06]|uniref:Uncharacterized protein n=1 Tax=Clostridium thailandense TaxID=2794346 RepID=A0A949TQK4_9CLOT|nr:hypothetical protein [Clostridium thailandense]MBV7271406.1 hypothetical protein [Clostridium thailandense]MCH5136148.1 hypothetical protein [Clostridiaceae bacterium UIB06]
MLKLTWIELFLRTIPEMFIFIWGIHVLSKKCINIGNYIFFSILMAVIIFFVRWLPIYFGVHMIINIILTISVVVIIGIPIIKAIYSTLLMYFILSLSEFINMAILNLLNSQTSFQLSNPLIKCELFSPSLFSTLLFVIVMNYLSNIKNREKIYEK